MQIKFEAKKIKSAHAYVDRLNPSQKKSANKTSVPQKRKNELDKSFYTTQTEENPSVITRILNFLFK